MALVQNFTKRLFSITVDLLLIFSSSPGILYFGYPPQQSAHDTTSTPTRTHWGASPISDECLGGREAIHGHTGVGSGESGKAPSDDASDQPGNQPTSPNEGAAGFGG